MTYTPVDDNTAKSLIGEGVHTGLRKAVDSPHSAAAWQVIHTLPAEDWDATLAFCVEGLKSMGYVLCKQEEPS